MKTMICQSCGMPMKTDDKFGTNELNLKDTYPGIDETKNIHGYSKKNDDFGNWLWNSDDLFVASGCISSTAYDLLQYARLCISGEKPYLPLSYGKHEKVSKNLNMGLGRELPVDMPVICKDGATGCFTSFLGFNPNRKIAVVVLSNYLCFQISKIGKSLFQSLYNKNQ